MIKINVVINFPKWKKIKNLNNYFKSKEKIYNNFNSSKTIKNLQYF